jgi:hypothetical protein
MSGKLVDDSSSSRTNFMIALNLRPIHLAKKFFLRIENHIVKKIFGRVDKCTLPSTT